MSSRRIAHLVAFVLLTPLAASAQLPASRGGVTAGTANPRSEAELKNEVTTRPQTVRAYIDLARFYRSSNRIDDAAAILRAGVPQVGSPDPLFEELAALYPVMSQPEKTLTVAEEWVRTSPGVRPLTVLSRAHLEIARRHRASPQEARAHVELAEQAVNDATALAPADPMARMARVTLLRTKLELEADPASRTRLAAEVEEAMRTMGTATAQGGSSGVGPSPLGVADTRPFGAPNAVRVGGNIRQPSKTKDARPIYPAKALDARIQGVVIVETLLDEQGKVADVRMLRSIPVLDEAALDAVRQWEFTPTLLNGQPVPVIMTVTVQFTLPQ